MKNNLKKLSKIVLVAAAVCGSSNAMAQEKLYPNTFPLSDVRLLDGPFKEAQELNIVTLLKYDTDRFLAPYLKAAGLTPKAENYGNWESDGLDGHVGGHYLSAMAIHYAATGNQACFKRMNYMVAELKACQEANGKKYPGWGVGYVGGVPNGADLWKGIKEGKTELIWKYWVPWYNVHKAYAGLRDAWLYGGNEDAKEVFLKFCDWAVDLTAGLTDAQMEAMLANEHGGMNEVLADAYQITGNEKYLATAKRFSHKDILNPLMAGEDKLDNKHANTQVPKAVGFQRIAEVANDAKYNDAGSFFWETVTQNRSLAIGGNSRKEFFPTAASCTDYINDVEGPESCNTNNMLKLTEVLFRMNPQAKYADFYERAMFNHILSTQHPEHGGYVYFTPARPRHYRVYSAPNEAMWCCVGTGLENHGKYGEFIYSHTQDSLFVNLFVASSLNWKAKKVGLEQHTNFPYEEKTELVITQGNAKFNMLLRYPSWVEAGKLQIKINGKKQDVTAQPSSYVSINRKWKKGDVVEISLPMHSTTEALPNVPSYITFLHGPIVLGAKTGSEDLKGLVAGSGRWEHIAGGSMLPVNDAPVIIDDNRSEIADVLKPVEGKPLHFTMNQMHIENAGDQLELEPFYGIHDSRYMMYWMQLSNDEYKEVLDSIAAEEAKLLLLEKLTVDKVQPGQQQPEADHFVQSANSNTGIYMNEFWRNARSGGFFSYQLNTNGETNLSLMVRYWGNEWGNRALDILIDGEKLVTEDTKDKWNVSEFRNVFYEIPEAMLYGKKRITVKFVPHEGCTAGGVFFMRLFLDAYEQMNSYD
ncbi:glycoside hydrolase family 127 protein [Plebeiibacterium marinum]|uniref:Glycoside hydrolase family 127 protein n=1 Tax=Plebeiibacterium marinum TaxID=2992111 RepID=A0AAE3MG57_9BACT|nr:glycoside hydrolase family 127 protein [Plebeiobacterium marinum]MCW3806955.1 glycoside hydrolase family 127 protein [Plebeiobacterium marinum]